MIRISFKPSSDARVIAAIKARGPKIVESLRVALDQSMLMLQRRIQEKLSGEVLQDRGGTLRRSIEKMPTEVRGSQIVGSVTGAGGPAFYGVYHEKGGLREYEILPGILTGKSNKRALAFFPDWLIRRRRRIRTSEVVHHSESLYQEWEEQGRSQARGIGEILSIRRCRRGESSPSSAIAEASIYEYGTRRASG